MAQTKRAASATQTTGKGRGGARPGAGRKSGSGAFGEATVPMRVPASLAAELARELEGLKESVARGASARESLSPLMAAARAKSRQLAELSRQGAAGKPVDLGKLLAARHASCYAWTAERDMPEWGLRKGDVLVVDRARQASDGCLAVFWREQGVELLAVEVGAKGASARRSGSKKPELRADSVEELADFWGVAVGLARSL